MPIEIFASSESS